MLIYREKENLFYRLHSLTLILYTTTIMILSVIFNHPLYLLGLLLSVAITIISSDNYVEWKGYLKISSYMLLIILIVNVLFVKAGTTIIYKGPVIPVIGRIKITMEALIFGLSMGIRLMIISSIFCLYTYVVNPDKALKLFSKFGKKTIIVLTLSTRLFPLMLEDYKRITEVQKCRGAKLDSGKWLERIKNTLPIFSVLLLSSLERSFQLAESMYSRGYGSGERSIYRSEKMRPRDNIINTTVILTIILSILTYIKGWSQYEYYPKLQTIDTIEIKTAIIITILLIIPAILNWGWEKCKTLKLKI